MNIDPLLSFLVWALTKGVRVSAIIFGAFLANLIIQISIERLVKKKIGNNSAKGKKKRSETLISIFGGTSRFAISLFAILMILPEFGVNIAALLAGVGILGLAIGMASREIIADFISGIFIIIENQYSVGDEVKIAGIEGSVEEITLRKTVIKDKEGMLHGIPNGQIKTVAKKL